MGDLLPGASLPIYLLVGKCDDLAFKQITADTATFTWFKPHMQLSIGDVRADCPHNRYLIRGWRQCRGRRKRGRRYQGQGGCGCIQAWHVGLRVEASAGSAHCNEQENSYGFLFHVSFIPFKVVFPSWSSPNCASSINARAIDLPLISVFIVRTPDERCNVPNAPRTSASAS